MANNDPSGNNTGPKISTNGTGQKTNGTSPPKIFANGNVNGNDNGTSPTGSHVPPILVSARDLLESAGHQKFLPVMEQIAEPGKTGATVQLQTNAFGIVLSEEKREIFLNDLTITGDLNGKVVEFSKRGRDDCIVNDRKEKCMAVINKLIETEPDVFPDRYKIFYDGQCLLYTLKSLFSRDEKIKIFELSGDQFDGDLARFGKIKCEFKKPAELSSFTFNREAQLEGTADLNVKKQNRHHHQFLEIAVNQHALNNMDKIKLFEHGKSYLVKPEGILIKNVGDGKEINPGAKKCVRQVQGPRLTGYSNVAVIVDAMNVPFHMEQNLAEKASLIAPGCLERRQPKDHERIQRVVRGIFVETVHVPNQSRRIQIHGISNESADNAFFEHNGEKKSVAAYFEERYNVSLQYPKAPLALCKERGRINSYPMELLKVLPMQRVTISQQTPEQSALSTRECAVDPARRQMLIMKSVQAMKFTDIDNQYMNNIGVSVKDVPFKVPGRILPAPEVKFGRKLVESVGGRWNSRDCRFLKPVVIHKWHLFCFQDSSTRYTGEHMQQFAETFMKEGIKRGMMFATKLPEFQFVKEDGMKAAIRHARDIECEFVLAVIADRFDLHHQLKRYEREFEVITQQVNMRSVNKIMIEKKFMTLENIVKKTNVKNGGLNYELKLDKLNGASRNWLSKGRLYLGIWVNIPPRQVFVDEDSTPTPMVVGYAANLTAARDEIIGDFALQANSHDVFLETLDGIVEECIARHKEAENDLQELVIYRSNTDEGNYAAVLTREIPIVKASLLRNGFPDVKLIYILVSKEHNVRLMKDVIPNTSKAQETNIVAGVVADSGVVSPSYKEFFLNSHTTLQGSALTPRYTVVYDECKTPMDSLEGFTWALTHLHQIVDLTISLPAPLYIARCYADRGRNIYNEKEISPNGSDHTDLKSYTAAIRFGTSQTMKNKRVNA